MPSGFFVAGHLTSLVNARPIEQMHLQQLEVLIDVFDHPKPLHQEMYRTNATARLGPGLFGAAVTQRETDLCLCV